MTANPRQPEPPGGPTPAPHPTLDYAKSDRTMPVALQWILGILLGVVPILALGFFSPFALGMAGAVIGPLAPAVVLVPIAWRLRRRGYCPMASWILTGVAVGLLVDGLCVAALMGRRISG